MDSHQLYTRVDGPENGEPLLLLHGGPGAHHDYLYPQMLFLAEKYRVITYDQRGGGRSKTDDPTPITWQTHVNDVAEMIKRFDLKRPTIVGYSWGGLLALLYAIHSQNGSVPVPARLLLISPAPINKAWRGEFDRNLAERSRSPEILQMREQLAASGLRESDIAAYRQRSFELSVAGYFADPRLAHELTPFRVMGRVQQSTWESLGDYDLSDSLKLSIPSLVVHGRHDPIPLASSELLAQRLGATFVVLEQCGHVPYVEQPAALSAAIESFLSATTSSSAT